MNDSASRRDFFKRLATYGALAGGLTPVVAGSQAGSKRPPKIPIWAPDHTLTVISGKPHERGLQYGEKFKDLIQHFLHNVIYLLYAHDARGKDELLRYGNRSIREVRDYSPIIMSELEGIAQGAGLRLEEAVLITLAEELWHREYDPGVLPPLGGDGGHCTATAIGPPETRDGDTYVAMSADWREELFGITTMLLWKRTEGPSLLEYSWPGMWIMAAVNSAGVGLTWTSVENTLKIPSPRIGVPTYVLLTQMLYQDSLEGAIEEARRAKHAGWFAFMLADAKGQIAKVEGAPGELAIERHRGSDVGVYYCTRQMTRTPKGQAVKYHPQGQRMRDLIATRKGQLDLPTLQGFYGDHESTICKHYGTLDVVIFNTTRREAYVERGPGCSGRWRRFSFEG